MQQLRLFGLILFVTVVFLGFAAIVSQTTEIRVKRWRPAPVTADNGEQVPPEVQFRSVPVMWPLALAGGVGLMLWFVGAPRDPQPTMRGRRRSRRRRRRR